MVPRMVDASNSSARKKQSPLRDWKERQGDLV